MQNRKKYQIFFKLLLIVLFFSSSTLSYAQGMLTEAYLFDDHSLYSISLPSGSMVENLKTPTSEFITTIKFSPNQEFSCLLSGEKKYEATSLSLLQTKEWKKNLLLTVEPDSLITTPFWSPDSKHFVVLIGYQEIASGEFSHYEYYLLKLFSVGSNQFSDVLTMKEPVSSVSWSADSTLIAFNAKEDKEYALYVFHVNEKKLFKPRTALSSDWVFKNLNHWDHQDAKLFFIEKTSLFSYHYQENRYQLIKDLKMQVLIQQWNDDSNKVAIVAKDGQNMYLYVIDLLNGSKVEICRDYQIDSPRWSPNGKMISYFKKRNDQPYSNIEIFDFEKGKIVSESLAGSIEIYPWDLDPTYSQWSKKSDSLVFVIRKEEQKQILSSLSIQQNQVKEVSNEWDYLYNFGFSTNHEWIYITGSREEEDLIEFVPTNQELNLVAKNEFKFLEWKMNETAKPKQTIDDTQVTSKNTSIFTFLSVAIIATLLLILILLWIKRKKK